MLSRLCWATSLTLRKQLLQQHEDPFGAYGPANDSTTIFSILPPLSILSPSQNLSRTTSIKADDEVPRPKRELSIVSEESKTPTVTVTAADMTSDESDVAAGEASPASEDSGMRDSGATQADQAEEIVTGPDRSQEY